MRSSFLKYALIAATIVVIFIFASSRVFALDFKNPSTIEELDIGFRQHGGVLLSGGNFQNVAVNITTLQNNENQKVSALSSGTLIADARGNKKLSLETKNPIDSFQYSVSGAAKISATHVYSIPSRYTISEDVQKYLLPTKNIQSDDEEIKQLAQRLTKGVPSDFEKAAILATWVNNNVNYTLDLGSEAKDALWVLHNRIGTCDEFTALFIALARSAGIPAKYVSGYVYGDNGWQKHAWAEIYLGKWIPVDATWLEVGRLDATHIKFFETDDNYVANEAKAYGGTGGKLSWIEDETDFEVKNYRALVPAEYNAYLSSEKLSAGSFLVVAKLESDEYMADKFILEPCTGMDILRVENKKQSIVLEPKKTAVLTWKLSINPELDTSKIFTCPVVLNSNVFGKKTLSFDADPRVQDAAKLSASIEKSFFSIGEEVSVKITEEGSASKIGVATDAFAAESAPAEEGNVFSFRAQSVGNHAIYAYDSAGNLVELGYSVQETGKVSIEKIDAPAFVRIGSKPAARIVILNEMNAPQNVKLDAKIDGTPMQSESFTIPARSEFPVNFSIPADSVGGKKMTIRLIADSVEESVKTVRVYDAPELQFGTKYNSGKGLAEVTVAAQKDEAKNIEITIAGRKQAIASSGENSKAYFEIPAGEYDLTAKYEDVAGKQYKVEGKLKFEESFLERIIYTIKHALGMA